MAITFPLSLPTTPGIKQVRMIARPVVAVSEAPFSFARQTQIHQGQRWEAIVTLPQMLRPVAELWLTWRLKMNGREGTCLFGDPDGVAPRGSVPGTPLVKGGSQTGGELITDGWGLSQTNVVLAGDYVQLGTGSASRLYKILDDASSDGVGSGEATLTIWPKLRVSPGDNDALILTDAKGVFEQPTNETPWDADALGRYGISFALVEAL